MSTDEKARNENGTGSEGNQKKLTTSVGTPLAKPEKSSRRKFFGRRERPAAK